MLSKIKFQSLSLNKYLFLLLAITGLFLSCNENMPVINCLSCENDGGGPDGPGPQDKIVLVEEFTGVKCIGCPAGSTELQNLINQSNGRLIAVSIHAGFFAANPYPGQESFSTEDGESIMAFLGQPEANPAAVVDRKLFPGEADLQFVNTSSWAGRIAQQYEEVAKVSMVMTNDYNSDNRTLTVKVTGAAQELIDEEVRLTILIAESGIVSEQLTPETSPDPNPDYVHNHMLRDVITAFDGDVLATNLVEGAIFEETYTYTLPDGWEPANCDVIAFTHLSQSNKEVLQATEAHLAD